MARKPTPRRPRKADVKAAAERAEKRSKGEPIETPSVPIDPVIAMAGEIKRAVFAKLPKKPKGRRSKYTPAVAKAICKMLASGMSVRAIGRRAGMPAATTILLWARTPGHPFSEHYARAREIGYLRMADELLEIADDGSNDWMERETKSGHVATVANEEHLARSRLRVDTRKWVLAKMLPKIYGEKVAHEHTGADGGPIQVEDKMALARWIAFELAAAGDAAEAEAVH